ncbi:MAG: restriction endonuclease, partial [Kovacikia sp.]
YQVVRNSRYTGDDGIDGRIYRDGKLYYVQAKRYSGLIDAAHLRAFEQKIVNSYGVEGGFFVHTGRTGDTAKAVSKQQGQVTLLSGMRLVDFVLARGVASAQKPIAVAEANDPW